MLSGMALFIVYFVKSEHSNEECMNYYAKNGVFSFNLVYDENKRKIISYYDGQVKDVYSVDSVLGRQYRNRFYDWIKHYKNNNDSEKSLIVRSQISNKLFKIEMEDYKNHIFYAKANYVDDDYEENQVNSSLDSLLDYDDFKKISNDNKKKRISVVAVIKFNLFKTILNRYGEEVAEQYIKKLYYLVQRNTDYKHGEFMSFYKDDSFVVARNTFLSSFAVKGIMKNKLKELTTLLNVDNYQFEVSPYIGACNTIIFNCGVEEAVERADKICNVNSDEKRIFTFDESSYKELMERKRKDKIVEDFENNFSNYVNLVDALSFIGGEDIGVFPEIKPDMEQLYNSCYIYCRDNNKLSSFIYGTLNSILKKHYESGKTKKQFLFLQFESLSTFINVFANHDEYKSIDVVAVITDYDALFDDVDKKRDILRKVISNGITLGIIASPDMLVKLSGLLHLFKWLVIPHKLANIVNEEKGYITVKEIIETVDRLDLNIIAWHIDKYEIAKVLKDLGVDYISGSVLSLDYGEYNSTRRISKLIEERKN